jgi:hypothetical protein
LVPLFKVIINEQVGDELRATINSVLTAMFRVVTATLGPIVGASVDRVGAHDTLFLLIMLVVPGLILLLIWQQRMKKDHTLAATAQS